MHYLIQCSNALKMVLQYYFILIYSWKKNPKLRNKVTSQGHMSYGAKILTQTVWDWVHAFNHWIAFYLSQWIILSSSIYALDLKNATENFVQQWPKVHLFIYLFFHLTYFSHLLVFYFKLQKEKKINLCGNIRVSLF